MKERLKKLLEAKQAQRSALNASMIDSDSKEERAAIGETLSKLEEEIAEVEAMLAEIDEPAPGQDEGGEEGRGLNVLGTMQTRTAQPQRNVDRYDTDEYRTAFMNFVCRNVPIPAEMRSGDETTTTTEASAVIPTTILNEIVKELKSYGNLYARVRKLNVQGGVKIPILSLKPTANWITADTATSESDLQKIQANTSVAFSYYGLECKVSQTLLVNVTTLSMFQEQFVTLAVEAMAKALDVAIIKGSGSGEPEGIVNNASVTAVTLSATDVKKWDEWKKKVFAKIPISYNNGLFIMAKGTFDGYIDGMVDSNGQPIGRVNYGIGDGEKYYFAGKEVLLVEPDVLKDWDSATGHASTGDPVVVYCNLSDYAINSNMEMQTVKWIDNDKNEIKNKCILIADGKLIDPNGVVVVKKGV